MASRPVSGTDRIRSLDDQDSIYSAFDAYPWAKDKAFLVRKRPPCSLAPAGNPLTTPPPRKSGLSAILGEPNSQGQNPRGSPADIATHARIFYYAQRIGVRIDFAAYHAWLASRPDHQPPRLLPQDCLSPDASGQHQDAASSALSWQQAAPRADLYVDRSRQSPSAATGEPNYPMGFADMLRLLQEGKPIPGIRQIPNTIARDPVSSPLTSPGSPRGPCF